MAYHLLSIHAAHSGGRMVNGAVIGHGKGHRTSIDAAPL
jgi:hypothetical protein